MEQAKSQKTAPQTQPIIVILGQTATGKSALGMQLAQELGGEIICADSRTVYRHMDIGTAKPSADDRALVPHHGLDLVEPSAAYSAAAFQKYSQQKVSEIHQRGRVPIIIGGTGLYIDGYVYDFSFAAKPDPALRTELEALTLPELQARAVALGIEPSTNPRHLSRAIERGGALAERKQLPSNVLLFGLTVPRDVLYERIDARVDTMFTNGLVDEVQELISRYGAEAPGLLAPGYKAVGRYLEGAIDLAEAQAEFRRSDKRLAKRQMTWFKRNPDIRWVKPEDALSSVKTTL